MELKFTGRLAALCSALLNEVTACFNVDLIIRAFNELLMPNMIKDDDTLLVLIRALIGHLLVKFDVVSIINESVTTLEQDVKDMDLGNIDLDIDWRGTELFTSCVMSEENTTMSYASKDDVGETFEQAMKKLIERHRDFFTPDNMETKFLKAILPSNTWQKLSVWKIKLWLHQLVARAEVIDHEISVAENQEKAKRHELNETMADLFKDLDLDEPSLDELKEFDL